MSGLSSPAGSTERAARYARAAARWARLATSKRVAPGLRISYGHDRVPSPGEPARGGTSKSQKLAQRFPNHPADFTLLYLGSSWLPRDLGPLLKVAARRGAPVVVNQDGAAYPAWAGARWAELNVPLRRAFLAADHVLFQSEFARLSAQRYLGEPRGTWELLPNAVDVDHFSPADEPPSGDPTILLGGDQYQAYKLELGLRTLAEVRRTVPQARLVVTGDLAFAIEPLVEELELHGAVECAGRIAQRDLPTLLRRGHVYLHPKVNDPCPTAVLEALACGLPVVYSASGGTVELVGNDAGVGVPHPFSWEREQPPAPSELARGVVAALHRRSELAAAARARAVERYALEPWLRRHEALFLELNRARTPAG